MFYEILTLVAVRHSTCTCTYIYDSKICILSVILTLLLIHSILKSKEVYNLSLRFFCSNKATPKKNVHTHNSNIRTLLYIYLKYSLFKHKQWNACGALKWQPWKLHAMLAILLGSLLSTCVKGMSFKGSVVIIQQFPGAIPYCTIFLFF